jgi:ubiquilin
MAEPDAGGPSEGAASEETLSFTVKGASETKYDITLASTKTVADLKTKLSTSEYADVPPERQRLIYSGRVLKDGETLASTKIKNGHTIHLVKSAASNARQNPANASSTPSVNPTPAANVPSNIAAGTGHNPLAALTGARYAGFHGLPSASSFGADGGVSYQLPALQNSY